MSRLSEILNDREEHRAIRRKLKSDDFKLA
jgi:hypothetical protein